MSADVAAPDLVRKPISHILTFWRPGSQGDDWTWADEYEALHDDSVTEAIRERVFDEGIDFIDHLAPVLLGNDGRVWDGHHRICIAIECGLPALMVEVVPTDTTPP